jgi:hypothetical protein
MRLKKKTKMKKKKTKHGWHVINFVKDAFWYLNFKNHLNYIISTPQYFSNSIMVQKFIFIIFYPRLKDEREVVLFLGIVNDFLFIYL